MPDPKPAYTGPHHPRYCTASERYPDCDCRWLAQAACGVTMPPGVESTRPKSLTPESVEWHRPSREILAQLVPAIPAHELPTTPVPPQVVVDLMADEVLCRRILAVLKSERKAPETMDFEAELHLIQSLIAQINLHNFKFGLARQQSAIITPNQSGRLV